MIFSKYVALAILITVPAIAQEMDKCTYRFTTPESSYQNHPGRSTIQSIEKSMVVLEQALDHKGYRLVSGDAGYLITMHLGAAAYFPDDSMAAHAWVHLERNNLSTPKLEITGSSQKRLIKDALTSKQSLLFLASSRFLDALPNCDSSQ